jgi:FkbM family methyltransferase
VFLGDVKVWLKRSKWVCLAWVLLQAAGLAGEPERRVLKLFVKPGDTVVDLGAYIGTYTYKLSRLVGPVGRVLAVDPSPDNCAQLAFLAKTLRLANVRIEEAAVAGAPGRLRLTTPANRAFGHLIMDTGAGTGGLEVAVTTLSALAAKYGLESVSFLKCDVEGAERFVFEGGEALIQGSRPVILCEINQSAKFGLSDQGTLSYIRALGDYDVFICSGGRWRRSAEVVQGQANYLFVPRPFSG